MPRGRRRDRIALVSIDATIGDVAENTRRVLERAREARDAGAEVAIFPELVLSGYPPEDLLELPDFLDEVERRLGELARAVRGVTAVVGFPTRRRARKGKPLHNALAVLRDGRVAAVYAKRLLPTYDVFDESRYFEPGTRSRVVATAVGRLGLTICEDAWNDKSFWERPLYPIEPMGETAQAGAELLVNAAASPFSLGKRALRRRMLERIARRTRRPLLFVNLVGGNDDLLFDGSSGAFDARGRLVAALDPFEEGIVYVDPRALAERPAEVVAPYPEGRSDELPVVWKALVTGLRDYARKCGFRSAVLGLSGGIDSALTATIAAEALGPENVHGVLLPGPYSSPGSLTDAHALVANLGIRSSVIPIGPAFDALRSSLAEEFRGLGADVTEENLQARVRGTLLMALSNKHGHLLLTTGNKSELAVGYATLYGDMCGGLAVISDLPKTLVYALADHANSVRPRIPPATIAKPPSAELRPDQTDQDSLPPYALLDAILERAVERMEPPQTIARELGVPLAEVREILRMIDRAEYKRQQSAPGLRISSKAFGPGRRFPIAQRFRR